MNEEDILTDNVNSWNIPADYVTRQVGFNEDSTKLILVLHEDEWNTHDIANKDKKMELARGTYEILYYARRHENGQLYTTVNDCRRLSGPEQQAFNKVKPITSSYITMIH